MKFEIFKKINDLKILGTLLIILTLSNVATITVKNIKSEKVFSKYPNFITLNQENETQQDTKLCCKPLPQITVLGSAQANVKTEVITIGIQIDTKRPLAQDALQINTQTSNTVTKSLLTNLVKTEDISTVNFTISPQYIFVEDKTTGVNVQKFDGYLVSNFLEIKTKKIKIAGKIIDAAVSAGATIINYVNFDILPITLDKIQTKLVNIAVKDAANKAIEALQPLFYKISEVSYVKLSDVSPLIVNNRPNSISSAKFVGSPILFNNKKQITVTVNVTFLIERMPM